MAKCLMGPAGGGKVMVEGLSPEVVLAGQAVTVKQGTKVVHAVTGSYFEGTVVLADYDAWQAALPRIAAYLFRNIRNPELVLEYLPNDGKAWQVLSGVGMSVVNSRTSQYRLNKDCELTIYGSDASALNVGGTPVANGAAVAYKAGQAIKLTGYTACGGFFITKVF